VTATLQPIERAAHQAADVLMRPLMQITS